MPDQNDDGGDSYRDGGGDYPDDAYGEHRDEPLPPAVPDDAR